MKRILKSKVFVSVLSLISLTAQAQNNSSESSSEYFTLEGSETLYIPEYKENTLKEGYSYDSSSSYNVSKEYRKIKFYEN